MHRPRHRKVDSGFMQLIMIGEIGSVSNSEDFLFDLVSPVVAAGSTLRHCQLLGLYSICGSCVNVCRETFRFIHFKRIFLSPWFWRNNNNNNNLLFVSSPLHMSLGIRAVVKDLNFQVVFMSMELQVNKSFSDFHVRLLYSYTLITVINLLYQSHCHPVSLKWQQTRGNVKSKHYASVISQCAETN